MKKQLYFRCPQLNKLVRLPKSCWSGLSTSECLLEISRLTKLPIKSLWIGSRRLRSNEFLSKIIPNGFVEIRLSLGGLSGGKGGFGAMLRQIAKNCKVTHFGAMRDLSGRRVQHVEQDEELARWKEEQKNKAPVSERERQKDYKYLKESGRFREKRMCTFGANCRYQWKCRFRHPGDDEEDAHYKKMDEKSRRLDGPLKNFFGKRNKPLRGVIGANPVKDIRSAIKAGLEKKRKLSVGKENINDNQSPSKKFRTNGVTPEYARKDLSMPLTSKRERNEGKSWVKMKQPPKYQGQADVFLDDLFPDINDPPPQKTQPTVDVKLDNDSDDFEINLDDLLPHTMPTASQRPLTAGLIVPQKIPQTDPTSNEERKDNTDPDTNPPEKENFPALDFSEISSKDDLVSLGFDRLKFELSSRGLKCGGTLDQRAERLFLLKTTSLDKLHKKHFAKKKKRPQKIRHMIS